MSTSTTLPLFVSKDLEEQKARNDAFIHSWKRTHGVMKQGTLQTKTEAFSAWVLSNGWTMRDMKSWSALCEKAKTAQDGDSGLTLQLLGDTLEFALHLDVHPIGLICFTRVELKCPDWDLVALGRAREHLLEAAEAEDDVRPEDHDDDVTEDVDGELGGVCPPAPRKRAKWPGDGDDESDGPINPGRMIGD